MDAGAGASASGQPLSDGAGPSQTPASVPATAEPALDDTGSETAAADAFDAVLVEKPSEADMAAAGPAPESEQQPEAEVSSATRLAGTHMQEQVLGRLACTA